MYIIIRFGLYV